MDEDHNSKMSKFYTRYTARVCQGHLEHQDRQLAYRV